MSLSRRALFQAGLATGAGVVLWPATTTSARAATSSSTNTALYWSDVLLDAIRQVPTAPTVISRTAALMHLAMYDAATSVIDIGQPYYQRLHPSEPGGTVLLRGSINRAAYGILTNQYPSLSFDNALFSAPKDTGATHGVVSELGTAAAQEFLSNRSGDGSGSTTPYVPSTTPGQWRPTPPDNKPAVTPNWGKVTPWALSSGSQYRPPLPLGFSTTSALLASSQYASQLNGVKAAGAQNSTTRTTDQTRLAHFWANDADGTYKPLGQYFALTAIVATAKNLGELQTVRLFAQVALAMADAGIAAWDAKFDTSIDLWRPITGIRNADIDNNAATTADKSWLPLSVTTPAFPSYISGHSTFVAAWAGTLRRYFGSDSFTFTATTDDPNAVGATRTFSSYSAAANECAISRYYLGVHYKTDADQGLVVGDQVAGRAFTTKLLVS